MTNHKWFTSIQDANPVALRLLNFTLTVLITSLTTTCLFLLRERLNTSTVTLLYFVPILISTTLWGLWAGVLSAFIAFLSYNYFFLPPYYTLLVHETQDIITLIIFLVITVFVNQLLGRSRSSLAAVVARESDTTRLYELSLDLAGVNSLDEIANVIARKTVDTVAPACLEIQIHPIFGEAPLRLSLPEGHPKPMGAEVVIPLETVRAHFGDIHLTLTDGHTLPPHEERMIYAFAAQGALALERTALANSETRAKVLEESDRLKSSLLNSVSHEFRTPIATIKAATTSLLIEDVPWEAADRQDLLSVVDEAADYLNYLVGNLLDMSRIEAGALKPNRQWNLLSEILDGVLTHMHRILKNYQVEQKIPDELPLVLVDYMQIEQVFTNLLHNSAKYGPDNSLIQIAAQVIQEDCLQVTITNEGPQVKPELLDRIFDKFFRVTEPEKVSGTGLGLSICKGIIEAHEGQIWAENIPGGLAFNFTLPCKPDGILMHPIETETE